MHPALAGASPREHVPAERRERNRRLAQPPRPHRRPIGRRRCDRTPAAGAALPAGCGGARWSRFREPRQNAAACTAACSPLECEHERLRSELVSEITSGTSMEIPVDRAEVALEDQLERIRLAQRARHAIRVRQNRLHHRECARSVPLVFTGSYDRRKKKDASGDIAERWPTRAGRDLPMLLDAQCGLGGTATEGHATARSWRSGDEPGRWTSECRWARSRCGGRRGPVCRTACRERRCSRCTRG